MIEDSLRCTMCGTAQWEWDADRFAYEPVLEHCPGCYAKETAAKDLDSSAGSTVQLSSSRGAEAEARHARARALAERDARDAREDDDED